uniref:C4 n=1 Tax=Mungbean yellow mosaic India virus TaxID=223287 RepID=Q52UQ2_9GEMI|nr:AC4 [Mungbean yellow mosaic India virus]ASN77426.1 AC4 [Mungbean yellow mosaic India virus]AYL64545.1 C4 [Mungbean yellow mosaic India virus]QGN65489.1 C4 protein [Mungbean yellow mosaic India virus]QGN65495.1 C4 protein [Mungbean yellow mosaic India virus]
MKMDSLISMFCFSSKGSNKRGTKGSSTSIPDADRHITIRTFRQLKAAQTLKNTWRKTETSLIMELSKSMADQLEEVNNLPTTHTPRHSIVDRNWRPSLY